MFTKHSFLIYGFIQLFIFGLPMLAHCLSDNQLYEELDYIIYLYLPLALANGLAFLQLLVMEKMFPSQYDRYQVWASKGKEHSIIYFVLITAGYFLLIFLIFGYSDQYHMTTPIKSYEFTASGHYKKYHRRTGFQYYTVFKSPLFGKYEIYGKDYYNTVDEGDSITLFLREGRFHTYYVIESKLNKLPPKGYQNLLDQYASSYNFKKTK